VEEDYNLDSNAFHLEPLGRATANRMKDDLVKGRRKSPNV
jgi:hypothetical protein